MTDEAQQYVREVDGRSVPIAGTWTLDPAHTAAEFTARHLMITKVRGGFSAVSGSFTVGDDPRQSTVEVSVEAASISTGTADRDAHLTSPDFLDVENYPTLSFVGTSMESDGDAWVLHGELTIRDVTRPVDLRVDFHGTAADPWGNTRTLFSARGQLVRADWGITWNVPLESGGVLVSKSVDLEIEAQATLAG